MNIDISNAHCGFRTLSVTHAWPRVARHSNPPARRQRRAGARGRAQPAVWPLPFAGERARPVGGGVLSRIAKRNARRPRRRRSPRGFADPARRFHSSPSARTVVSSCALQGARRWRPGAGGSEPGGPSNDVGVVPAWGGALVGAVPLLACSRPASPSTGGAAAAAGESLARPRIR